MHRALAIPEIQLAIIDNIEEKRAEHTGTEDRRPSAEERETLIALGLTCKAFFPLVLPYLWRVVPSLAHIVKTFPASLWYVKVDEEGKVRSDGVKVFRNSELRFRRKLEQTDWSSFDMYARHVNHLSTCQMAPEDDWTGPDPPPIVLLTDRITVLEDGLFAEMEEWRASPDLFPRMDSLTFCGPTYQVIPLRYLLYSNIKHLKINKIWGADENWWHPRFDPLIPEYDTEWEQETPWNCLGAMLDHVCKWEIPLETLEVGIQQPPGRGNLAMSAHSLTTIINLHALRRIKTWSMNLEGSIVLLCLCRSPIKDVQCLITAKTLGLRPESAMAPSNSFASLEVFRPFADHMSEVTQFFKFFPLVKLSKLVIIRVDKPSATDEENLVTVAHVEDFFETVLSHGSLANLKEFSLQAKFQSVSGVMKVKNMVQQNLPLGCWFDLKDEESGWAVTGFATNHKAKKMKSLW
ncbi:hypothetical protein BT63DRAFT_263931 [Microthyrium microscopicum]|uniref:Uncharacterized protein n=1 Tax=Microthyrium microscopicum TaxID=703497 RepID=A0A6A6UD36_9PEZI|nr:hypothetical protein BT63DRAFT_263931 [Microthyrium microscopicum]